MATISHVNFIKELIVEYSISDNLCQIKFGTFYSEVQPNLKGQLESAKIVSNETLTINQLISMSYKHFTPDQRNELSALLRANLTKKEVAKVLRNRRASYP